MAPFPFQYLQNPDPVEKSVNFKVLVVEKSSTLIDFMSDKKISSTEKERVFYELSPADKGFSLLHYVEVATIDDSKVDLSPLYSCLRVVHARMICMVE